MPKVKTPMNPHWEDKLTCLEKITDVQLLYALKEMHIDIPLDKYRFAFSAICVPEIFSNISEDEILRAGGYPKEFASGVNEVKSYSFFIIKGYISFLYMRSDVIEKRLNKNNISKNSPLYAFSEILSHDKKCPTPGQRIRNALAHGGIEVDRDEGKLVFNDLQWTSKISFKTFDGFCNQIKRFYLCLFEASKRV